jgi:hypothetical protein
MRNSSLSPRGEASASQARQTPFANKGRSTTTLLPLIRPAVPSVVARSSPLSRRHPAAADGTLRRHFGRVAGASRPKLPPRRRAGILPCRVGCSFLAPHAAPPPPRLLRPAGGGMGPPCPALWPQILRYPRSSPLGLAAPLPIPPRRCVVRLATPFSRRGGGLSPARLISMHIPKHPTQTPQIRPSSRPTFFTRSTAKSGPTRAGRICSPSINLMKRIEEIADK